MATSDLRNSLTDNHPSWSDHVVSEQVALLEYLQHHSRLNSLRRLGGKRFLCGRVEFLPPWIHRLDAIACQRVPQAPEHEQDAVSQCVVGVSFGVQTGSFYRSLKVVEHGHNLPKQVALPAGGCGLHLGRHPLAKVLEIGLRPLGQLQVLVPLPLRVLKQRIQIVLNLVSLPRISRGWRCRGNRPRGRVSARRGWRVPCADRTRGPCGLSLVVLGRPHDSSPSSTTSASTTSSSSPAPPSAEAPSADCAAAASACAAS